MALELGVCRCVRRIAVHESTSPVQASHVRMARLWGRCLAPAKPGW